MFDFLPQTTVTTRSMIVVDSAQDCAQELKTLIDKSTVTMVDRDDLASRWSDYVVARAQNSGALITDAPIDSPAFNEIESGSLDGAPMRAGIMSGVLVFAPDRSVRA
ncbi:MAG: hypothetical protein MRY63_01075 [Neomegalonema sp.]|nr:hypothetical protein [Neomegalonema sp.]